jgi:hypothetical protein
MEKRNITIPSHLLPDTVFVPPILNYEPHKVCNVMQKNEYGKHELIGKIYHKRDKYIAEDIHGKRIFADTKQLSGIKERFKAQGMKKESRMNEIEDLRDRKSKVKNKSIDR